MQHLSRGWNTETNVARRQKTTPRITTHLVEKGVIGYGGHACARHPVFQLPHPFGKKPKRRFGGRSGPHHVVLVRMALQAHGYPTIRHNASSQVSFDLLEHTPAEWHHATTAASTFPTRQLQGEQRHGLDHRPHRRHCLG